MIKSLENPSLDPVRTMWIEEAATFTDFRVVRVTPMPTARVYLGSYNFSEPADEENSENSGGRTQTNRRDRADERGAAPL